jgi:hypothetical protein
MYQEDQHQLYHCALTDPFINKAKYKTKSHKYKKRFHKGLQSSEWGEYRAMLHYTLHSCCSQYHIRYHFSNREHYGILTISVSTKRI